MKVLGFVMPEVILKFLWVGPYNSFFLGVCSVHH